MTFEEFQALCNQAVSTNQQVLAPCPITVGDEAAPIQSTLGDTPFHQLVIFRMKPDDAALHSVYDAVRFTFATVENAVAISPITTGG
jgi:hypothetical protein